MPKTLFYILIIVSMIFALYEPIVGWGIIALPSVFIAWHIKAAKAKRQKYVPELSVRANSLLQRYSHYYLWPMGCRDFAASAVALGVWSLVLGIVSLFQGVYWGVCVGIVNSGFMAYSSFVLHPALLIKIENLQAEHEEVLEYIFHLQRRKSATPHRTSVARNITPEAYNEGAVSFCPECGATYVISEGVCSDCGVSLERLEAAWNTSHGTDEKDETSCPASIDVERTEKYKGASCDHDLWDRFIGRGNSDEVLEEKAEYIAPILVHASIASADKLAESDQESDSLLIEEDSKMSCTWEFLALHIHYLDRIIFNSLGATKRDIFIDKLVPCVVLSLVKDGRYGPKDDFPRALLEGERSLVKLVNLRQVEYAVYDRIMADSDNLAGSLMWEAARSISEALGYKDDAYAIFQVYAVFTNYLIAYKFHKLIEMS